MVTDGVCMAKRNEARRCVDGDSDFYSQVKSEEHVGNGVGGI